LARSSAVAGRSNGSFHLNGQFGFIAAKGGFGAWAAVAVDGNDRPLRVELSRLMTETSNGGYAVQTRRSGRPG
jgi:hypothetical protein